jgi:hypothetical protein
LTCGGGSQSLAPEFNKRRVPLVHRIIIAALGVAVGVEIGSSWILSAFMFLLLAIFVYLKEFDL